MPGSANFVGEILILFGTFETNLVLRPGGQRRRGARGRLHDPPLPADDAQPRGGGVRSRELSRLGLAALVPLVAVVVALGVVPELRDLADRAGDGVEAPGAQFFAGRA